MFKTIFAGPSLEGRMSQTDWRPSGFDYIRIILALGVILTHTALICYGEGSKDIEIYKNLQMFTRLIVPMFFALSGFLVAGSLERSKTLVTFLGLRVFRIVPALAMEVFLSALVLGPIFTTLALYDYFSDHKFHTYFLNILGEIHYTLPGVFEQNPFYQVNGQLWTVPYELACYIILSFFAIFGIFARRNFLLAMVVICYIGQLVNSYFRPHLEPMGAAGTTIVLCFIAGLLIYRFREKIVWSKNLFFVLTAVSLLLLCIPNGVRFCALPVAYITVYLGMLNPARNKIILSGDYSYGLYLYGFPIQQALYTASPIFRDWYMNFLGAAPVAILMAVFSWWIVEKPVLGRRQVLKDLEAQYLKIPLIRTIRGILYKFFGTGEEKMPTFKPRSIKET